MTAPGPTGATPVAAAARSILHVDMDAFFVACEVRRDPSLAGRPVVVGGAGERGVVAAASYEARRYGVHSAMPSVRARRLCPQAIFLHGDHRYYGEVSRQVRAILDDYTPLVEPIALDEAFCDVTGVARVHGTGEAIAHALRRRVGDELGLSCSVGVATTKLLAKLASEAAKPRARPEGVVAGRGVVVVAPGAELAFLHPHPVEALWGVGPATLARLARLGVTTVGELAALPLAAVVGALGASHGRHLHGLASGVDDRPVEPDRPLKSVGHEETFAVDLYDHDRLAAELARLVDSTASRLRAAGHAARTVTLKLRFGDFHTITRSHTLGDAVDTAIDIGDAARALLASVDVSAGVRLLGVSVSGLTVGATRQLSFGFDDAPAAVAPAAWDAATRAVDEVRRRFGHEAIVPAALAGPGGVRVARPGEQAWGPGDGAPPGDGPGRARP